MMIETDGLTRAFGQFVAVDNLSLKVEEGSIHGFVGPNGAGKTTTIKMLIGAIKQTKGTGLIKGYPIGSKGSRRLIGYCPERPIIYEDMTALEYLSYLAELSGASSKRALIEAVEMLGRVELDAFSDTKVGKFSAGMKQRIGLAQAMIHKPELLILDEPTANLDPDGRMWLISNLKQMVQEQEITVFISSHILPELEQVVDHVTLINKGRLIAEESITNLKARLSANQYVVQTSNDEAVIQILKEMPCVQEIHIGEDGLIHLTSSDPDTLQQELIKLISQKDIKLKHFGEEQVNLEDIYRKVMNIGEQ